jgi:biopolymer transport protein ExbB
MRLRRFGWAMIVLGAAALPGLAAEPGPGQKQSILRIIYQGIEIPTYFIVAGSLVTIALIVEHFLTVRRSTIYPAEQIRKAKQLIEVRNFRDCLETLRKSTTFFARTMTAALLHARQGFDSMHEAALEKSNELAGRMFRKAEFLNIIGNLGPLLGLLGTVWGMIRAFGSLGAGGGQAGAGELAVGISEALVNTMLGLALAIVGLGFFGVCRNRIDSLTVSATGETLDLLEYFRAAPTPPPKAPEVKRVERAAAVQPASAGPAAPAS